MTESASILVLDELVSKPGDGRALHELYMRKYAQPACERGMKLSQALVEPCFWQTSGSNRLIFLWSIQGAGEAWRQKILARGDQSVRDAWAEIDARADSRSRAMLCDPDNIERLCDV